METSQIRAQPAARLLACHLPAQFPGFGAEDCVATMKKPEETVSGARRSDRNWRLPAGQLGQGTTPDFQPDSN